MGYWWMAERTVRSVAQFRFQRLELQEPVLAAVLGRLVQAYRRPRPRCPCLGQERRRKTNPEAPDPEVRQTPSPRAPRSYLSERDWAVVGHRLGG
jgi:hypothetical protein